MIRIALIKFDIYLGASREVKGGWQEGDRG
jgi:hypothetical protein